MMDEKFKAALKQPGVKAVTWEMTAEKKAKFTKMSSYILNYLRANVETPVEAYSLLTIIIKGFEEDYGIAGIAHLSEEDLRKQHDSLGQTQTNSLLGFRWCLPQLCKRLERRRHNTRRCSAWPF